VRLVFGETSRVVILWLNVVEVVREVWVAHETLGYPFLGEVALSC